MRHRLWPIVLSLCAVAGCTVSTGQIEGAVERELPRLVGPAESYQVNIQGRRGTREADRVEAVGRRVQPEGAPVLDRVDVVLQGVTYNADRRQLERVDSAEVVAQVRAADLAAYLERSPNLSGVSVALREPNAAVVRTRVAIPELGLGDTPVSVDGRVVGQGQRVNYVVEQVSAAGVTVTGSALNRVSDAINPLVDLAGMPIVLRVTEARVQGDTLVLRAVGSYPAR